MTVYRYPVKSVIGDYLRAAAGLIVTLGVLLSGPLPWFVTLIFWALTILFAVFALRTLKRQYLEVSLDNQGIATQIRPASSQSPNGHFSRYLAWPELTEVKLRYFGTRRNHHKEGVGTGGGGFMQLTLSSVAERKTSMSFESSLEGFTAITTKAAQAARAVNLGIDPATAGNLLTMGIDIDAESREEFEA
ncbi:hypothetical protein [Pelagibius sp. Alg239-R121]|uniref:hypothetical protein n=1 Tax=Pelagibius sp. Alg239-R121 TaxID=2993448 RepID=UPI0024A70307|nr:hypothetical protein [Pelagibius sp. Alg239-R121]